MEYLVTTTVDGRMIEQVVEIEPGIANLRDTIVRRVADTCETQLREALIRLGWTPPA